MTEPAVAAQAASPVALAAAKAADPCPTTPKLLALHPYVLFCFLRSWFTIPSSTHWFSVLQDMCMHRPPLLALTYLPLNHALLFKCLLSKR